MKIKMTLFLIVLFSLVKLGCKQGTPTQDATMPKEDIINNEFPEAQREIKEVLDGIFSSIQSKDTEKLASFHLYGPKFTAFSPGIPRQGPKENEESEKKFITTISSLNYSLNDLKIDVLGKVAVAIYQGDFEFTLGEKKKHMYTQTTLVFIKDGDSWKIIHEHSSPRNPDPDEEE